MLNGRRTHASAHRVVWTYLIGRIPPGLVINHINGVKDDNRPQNLELVTPSENARHAVRVLRVGRCANQDGGRNHAAKLRAEDIIEIRARRSKGELLRSIAKDYGVTMQAISKVVRRDRWNGV
jgi:hypothetical protein